LSFITLPVFSQDYPEIRGEDLFKDGIIKSKNFETTIPFEIIEDWIAVKLLVNGIELKFLFDTHASLTTLSSEFAKRLSLDKKGWITVQDGKGERQKTDIFKINNLKVGDLVCEGTSCVTTHLPNFMTEIGFDGLLGADIINRFNWKINFDKKEIVITDKRIEKTDKEEEFYFYMRGNVPYVTLKVGNQEYGYTLLDFGCSGGIIFPYKLASILNEKITSGDCYGQAILSNGLFGHGKSDSLYYVSSDNISISQLKLPKIEVEIRKNDDLIIIGMDVFSQYNITLDNFNYRYLFAIREKKEEEPIAAKKPLGIELVNRKLLVSRLRLCLESNEKSLEISDEIDLINEKSAKDFSSNAEFQTWFKEQKTVDIILSKNKKLVTIREELRRLIKDCD
jgi:Aspartyl protease